MIATLARATHLQGPVHTSGPLEPRRQGQCPSSSRATLPQGWKDTWTCTVLFSKVGVSQREERKERGAFSSGIPAEQNETWTCVGCQSPARVKWKLNQHADLGGEIYSRRHPVAFSSRWTSRLWHGHTSCARRSSLAGCWMRWRDSFGRKQRHLGLLEMTLLFVALFFPGGQPKESHSIRFFQVSTNFWMSQGFKRL